MTILIYPGLAWIIIPLPISFEFYGILYNSWRLFLGVISLPTFIIAIIALMYPESPKFLVSQGKTDEALVILQKIYTVNTGRDKSEFPVSTKIMFTFEFPDCKRYLSSTDAMCLYLGKGTPSWHRVWIKKGQDISFLDGYVNGIDKKYLVAIAYHYLATLLKVRYSLVDDLFHEYVWVSFSQLK